MHLGVCYYPEQWPQHQWGSDARRMAELGISSVRIAEFAWSRMEPDAGTNTNGRGSITPSTCWRKHGLKVIIGTPTATPPKWLIDRHPDILPVGADGVTLQFRLAPSLRFVERGRIASTACASCTQMARALRQASGGRSPGRPITNSACHDTVASYSAAARKRFGKWLADALRRSRALNAAWGNVFWSMEYRSFDEIGAAEPHAHRGATPATGSTSAVSRRARWRVSIACRSRSIRAHAPGRTVLHNFMGFFTELRSLRVRRKRSRCRGVGQLSARRAPKCSGSTTPSKRRWRAPGIRTFRRSITIVYRGSRQGAFWVMEQQAGPVNWAPWNPVPKAGHGASVERGRRSRTARNWCRISAGARRRLRRSRCIRASTRRTTS